MTHAEHPVTGSHGGMTRCLRVLLGNLLEATLIKKNQVGAPTRVHILGSSRYIKQLQASQLGCVPEDSLQALELKIKLEAHEPSS